MKTTPTQLLLGLSLSACATSSTTQSKGDDAKATHDGVNFSVEVPQGGTCVGFLPNGNGALVVTKLEQQNLEADNAPTETRMSIDFAMVTGASSPLARTFELAGDMPNAWRGIRAELDREIAPLSLRACLEAKGLEDGGKRSWTTPAGMVTEEWEPTPLVNSDDDPDNDVAVTGRVRLGELELFSLTSGPADGSNHERVEKVFFNEGSSSVAFFITNSDTGFYEERVKVFKTRE